MSRMINKTQIKKIMKLSPKEPLSKGDMWDMIRFVEGVMSRAGYETKCWFEDFVPFCITFKQELDWATEYKTWIEYDRKVWVVYSEEEGKQYYKEQTSPSGISFLLKTTI